MRLKPSLSVCHLAPYRVSGNTAVADASRISLWFHYARESPPQKLCSWKTRAEISGMANLSGNDVISIKSEGGTHASLLSDEHDNLPLKLRMKKFLSCKPFPDFNDLQSNVVDKESGRLLMPHIHAVVKKEDEYCNSQCVFSFPSDCFAGEGKDERLSHEENRDGKVFGGVSTEISYCRTSVESGAVDPCLQNVTSSQFVGLPGDCNFQGTLSNTYICSNQITCTEINADIAGMEKLDAKICTLPQHPTLLKVPGEVKVDYFENNLMSSFGGGINDPAGDDVQAVRIKREIPDDSVDDLDNIVLKERQRMLLQRKLVGVAKPVLEENSGGLSNPLMQHHMQHSAEKGKEDRRSVDAESSMAGSSGRTYQFSPLASDCQGTESLKSKQFEGIKDRGMMCSSERTSTGFTSCDGQNSGPANPNSVHCSALPTFVKVKVEPLNDNDLHTAHKNAVGNFSLKNILTLKSELKITDESYGDEIDHMPLRDRIKLLTSGKVSDLSISRNYECSRKIVPSALECSPVVSESVKPKSVNRPRKRRKTATDSVETALEEDAPGLLQVLIEKGVLLDEIRLYGEIENDDALDDSFNEDSFGDLEAVMSKLFSQRPSLVKLAPIRCTKGSKASYCLACLLSLVEQSRYLQFRKWPVEWGWCRDLQSFIFVFERHNRIVLERPEYGYATYFFELVDSLPIDWQIKRLVTAMKLTSCSRVTLIENKALLVGEDLTEGEAQVLMEYGWIPNSGLGTMLNYCDRVVHDRKNESDSSEWKSKICKLLTNGYNGGTIVSTDIPKKVVEYSGAQKPQIKLEL
ncbi:hypothetical protein L1049_002437 [Liquidambar formosana]|uniref:Uncharacterized protein n=1 Tax=Liquidambar formosana TaxID=63359 RepID=A0AAP0R8V3_LIQFO